MNIFSFIKNSWVNRVLIWRLTWRELESRFKGSFLGLFWAAILPLIMLGVFTLVFGSIFANHWSRANAFNEGEYSYPMILFLGLIIYGLMSEPIGRAPSLVLAQAPYVRKVVFPIEILPIVAVLNAMIMAAISFAVFLAVFIFNYGLPPVTIWALPAILLPTTLITVGLSYFLASLGVFLRDLNQVTGPLVSAMMFLSPLLYPLESLPEKVRPWLYLNPLTVGLNEAREAVFWGHLPPFGEWLLYFACSLVVLMAGGNWFFRTKKAFADVV